MSVRVSPYRMTPDPAAMVAFLEAVGLRVALASKESGYALMRAGEGLVGVHPGSAVQTALVLAVGTLEELDGLDDLQVWDESYGRQGGLVLPDGSGVWIEETQQDHYGYVAGDAEPLPGVAVTAVRYSTDFAADKAFFARLGLNPVGHEDEWWVALRAGAGSGTLGLHKNTGEPTSAPSPESPVGDTSLCGLGFETTEPLEQVRDRLTAAGYPATVEDQGHGLRAVRVVDPDGCEVQVHAAG